MASNSTASEFVPSTASDKPTELLTPDDVERDYQIKKTTQAAYRSRGLIPFVRIGPRLPRYSRAAIEAWIASKAIAPRGDR